ncbi:hypothetical protein EV360DRAFT_52879 [Lentinula raphanica]|nr:hypothetical protein EV360DRAFT_52879 [Lentinula raphanica]
MKNPVSDFLDRSSYQISDLALNDDEWEAIEGLVSMLKILKDATIFFSTSNPSVAAVIPAMDIIDEAFASGIVDTAVLSDPVHHALSIGKKTLNKYYELTDDSYVYRMAIVLHPSRKLDYFRNAKWPDAWVDAAVAVTRENWERTFKPAQAAGSSTPSTPEVSLHSTIEGRAC